MLQRANRTLWAPSARSAYAPRRIMSTAHDQCYSFFYLECRSPSERRWQQRTTLMPGPWLLPHLGPAGPVADSTALHRCSSACQRPVTVTLQRRLHQRPGQPPPVAIQLPLWPHTTPLRKLTMEFVQHKSNNPPFAGREREHPPNEANATSGGDCQH